MTRKRAFLFLQGPCSLLFARIADYLTAQGHDVYKINFNCGDSVYWQPRPALPFRQSLDELPEFLANVWTRYGITEQILFGDCRPVHRAAVANAKNFGIRTYVFDGGYFRPHWITMEREGVNGHSLLPRDPAWFRKIGTNLTPPSTIAFNPAFLDQAAYDIVYHLAGIANPLRYPNYKKHITIPPALEYACYIKRFSWLKLMQHEEQAKLDYLVKQQIPYYFLPLQLDTDAQILYHSNFANMAEVIETVLQSFAKHAPSHTQLVIKNHPLDFGLVNFRKLISQGAEALGLAGRTVYLESGHISTLISHALGMVTVNSTSGAHALELNCPTITLADPIYNMPGLTYQGGLDTFWTQAIAPDEELFQAFRNTVMVTTQINGSLYCEFGTKLAAGNAARLLQAEQSPLEKLLD